MTRLAISTTPYQETVAQQNAAADPAASVWLAASAGTGKTKVLTDRLLRLLLAGSKPENLLCLTYTKAAAAEMANRLFDTLRKWVTLPRDALFLEFSAIGLQPATEQHIDRARELFALVLDCPGGLRIQTLHSFCQELLQRFPLEAGLVPHFTVLDNMQTGALQASALAHLLQNINTGKDADLVAAFSTLQSAIGEHNLRKLLSDDLSPSIGQQPSADNDRLAKLLGVTVGVTATEIVQKACAATDEWRADLVAAAKAYLASDKPTHQKHGQKMADFLAASPQQRLRLWDDYVRVFLTDGRAKVVATLCPATVAKHLPRLPDIMAAEMERVLRAVEAYNAARVYELTRAFDVVARFYQTSYTTLKQQKAAVDFTDLIDSARGLLTKASQAAWVRYKIDNQIHHVLVDEAQDTSPAQWAILRALTDEFAANTGNAADAQTLFVVGDEKQSIYSFQGAAPHLFAAERARYKQLFTSYDKNFADLSLILSFRSTQAVLDVVNATFADIGLHQVASRTGVAGKVELWPLIEKPESPADKPWRLPLQRTADISIQQQLAQRIATTIRGWLESGEFLPGRDIPISAGDIMILVQRRKPLMEYLVRAMKEQNVPVSGVDELVLGEQLAVQDLLALINFVLLPEDDLNTATLLKTPLCGLDEEALFKVCHNRSGTVWREVQHQCPDIAKYLQGFIQARALRPYDFLQRALRDTCAIGGLSGLQAFCARMGDEVLDPLHELLQTALAFESNGPATLQTFVAALNRQEIKKKRELSKAAGKVRVMTVHASKGLQAPIVFLADAANVPSATTQPRVLPDPNDDAAPLVYVPTKNMDVPLTAARRAALAAVRREEYQRLLYVAMTRAEDRLIIAGVTKKADGEAPAESWYAKIAAAFKNLNHHSTGDGLIYQTGTATEKTQHKDSSTKPSTPLPQWALTAAAAENALARPLSPSRALQDDAAYASPLAGLDERRFTAGIMTHRLLELLPGKTTTQQDAIMQYISCQYRDDLTEQKRQAVCHEVQAILKHPEFAPLFGPGSRAEVPLVGMVDGMVVTGQVDRLLVTDTEVLVVDYKTNRPPPIDLDAVDASYIKQLQLYVRLLQKVYPTRIVKAALLWTDGPRLMAIPPRLL